jgi:hypothetical protein
LADIIKWNKNDDSRQTKMKEEEEEKMIKFPGIDYMLHTKRFLLHK